MDGDTGAAAGNGRGNLDAEGDRDTVWDSNGFHIYDTIASPDPNTGSQAQPRTLEVQPEIHADLDGHTDSSVFSPDEFSRTGASGIRYLRPTNPVSHDTQHGENSLLNSRQEGPVESDSSNQFPEPPSQSVLESVAVEGSQEEAERIGPENQHAESSLDHISVHEQQEEHEASGEGGSNENFESPLESTVVADERDSARQRKERRRAGRFSPLCREEGIASPEIKRSPESTDDEWE